MICEVVREKLVFIGWMLVNKGLMGWVLKNRWFLDEKNEIGMV